MKLLRASFFGVAGVPDGYYPFGHDDIPLDLVVVAGRPSTGKTRVLEAIAFAKEVLSPTAQRIPEWDFIAPGAFNSRIVLSWVFDAQERAAMLLDDAPIEVEIVLGGENARHPVCEYLLGRYAHGPGHPKVEYFPAKREPDPRGVSVGLDPLRHAALRTARIASKYSFWPAYLGAIAGTDAAHAFAHRLAAFGTTCSFDAGTGQLLSRREPRAAWELSSSEADAVILAATATAVGLDRSLVLVDRPEQCRGPAGNSGVLEGLRSLGDGAQVLAASSDESFIAAAPTGSVLTLA